MKEKKVFAMLLTASLILGVTACGSSDKENAEKGRDKKETVNDSDDQAGEELTIWAWDEAFNIKAAQNARDIYMKTNPDVEINIVTMAQDDIVAKLNTSLSSSSYEGLPDIVLIEDYKAQGYLTLYQDEFADLSDIVKAEDFAEYKTAVCQTGGKIYGVPFDSGVAATFYRKDYIEQAGFTQKDMRNLTWEKYMEIGKAVKEKCGVQMCTLDPSDI